MKALKIVAFVLGGLVALLAAVAAYLVATFDANKWKGEIAQLVQDKKGRSLKIEGELSLSLFPSIAVQLGKATLSEHKSEQVFAAVDSARVSLQLMPLLSKQVVVDTVALDGVKARLVRFKDGRMNIDDLIGKDDKEPPARFDIAGVRLAGGELSWRDEKAGQELTLSGLDLTTGRLANAATDKFDLSAKLAGSKPRLAAALQDLLGLGAVREHGDAVPGLSQQPGEHAPDRAGADDAVMDAHLRSSRSSTNTSAGRCS